MAYVAPTPADLKSHWPAFAAVPDTVVLYNITRANRSVDQTWTEGDYTTAIELLACHYMTLAGLGTGADAEANAGGMAGFSMIRSGQLTLQRASGADTGNIPAEWAGSLYGQQFYWLLKQNKSGVAVAGGTDVVMPSAYAKDWPYGPYGFPGLFY